MSGSTTVPQAAGAAHESEADVLELRIHGVSNTPPAGALGLAAHEVEPAAVDLRGVHGDALGSFWWPGPDARRRDQETPAQEPVRTCCEGDGADGCEECCDPRRIPPGVRREAYSWGAMARLSWAAPGGWSFGAVVSGVVRLLWVLVLPFGMANVAYWARRIPTSAHGAGNGRRVRSYQHGGAAAVRLFALVLTLLLTASTLTVTLDLVATKCLPESARGLDPELERVVCTALPDAVQALAFAPTAVRAAWSSAVPVALLVALWALGQRTRVRYEELTSARKGGEGRGYPGAAGATAEQSAPRFPLLSTPGFWTHRVLTLTGERVHLAAGIGFVAAVIGWSGAVSAAVRGSEASGCRRMRDFLRECDPQDALATAPGLVVAGLVGALVVAAAVWRTVQDSAAGADVGARRGLGARHGPAVWANVLVAGSVAAWAGSLVSLAAHDVASLAPPPAPPEPSGDGVTVAAGSVVGLGAAPSLLVAVLVGLCVCAVAWRSGARSGSWFLRPQAHLLYLAVVLGLGAWALLTGIDAACWTAGAAAVLLVGLVLATWARGRSHHGDEAWWGTGPAVFLLLAAGFAVLLSALVVLGAQSVLQRPAGTATFEVVRVDGREPSAAVANGSGALTVPEVYVVFGLIVGLALLAVAVAALATVLRRLRWIARAPGTWSVTTPDSDCYGDDDPRTVDSSALPVRVLRVLRMRRHAAAGQRAELVVGVLAAFFLLALLLSLTLALADLPILSSLEPGHDVARLAAPALGTAATLLAVSVAAAGRDGAGRPAGVLWDLMCFLPRAAHPFGPPCYAERVVPEVRGRLDAWLDALDLPPARRAAAAPRRRVVLSGHSNGGMLAAAVVLARSDEDQTPQRDVALLTYGTQLRGLFGRLFPELFGPAALGTPPLCRPRFRGADPWRSEVPRVGSVVAQSSRTWPRPGQDEPRRGSLAHQLRAGVGRGPRWRNLWRRTDFIGFPVCAYEPNPVDRGAEELDPRAYTVTVWHHSHYPAAPAYRKALDELLTSF